MPRQFSIAFHAALVLAAGGLLSCTRVDRTAKAAPAAESEQPGLFTVPADQLAHIRVAPVERTSWDIAIHTTGTVDWDADHTTQAITQVNGPISRILVDLGARVKEGDPLLYVSSPDVVSAIAAYRRARNRVELARRVSERTKDLLEHGAAAQKDYEDALADYNDAMTDVENSLQPLRIFGITQQEIDQAEKQGSALNPELPVRSPIDGTVVQKLVSPGQVIQAGQTACFAISKVETVWVQGHIIDADLPHIRTGDAVEETNPNFDRTFHGTLSYIGSFVDPATRTTPVRIVTQNPGGLLKKDMFVDAIIHTATQRNLLAVPVPAVLRDDKNEPMVYVQAQPGHFAQRSVTIGAQQNGLVAITNGLREGELVVTEGSIFLQFANSIQ
jgi:cobalt-zinc-cadmium efflux system membrane fusion protein